MKYLSILFIIIVSTTSFAEISEDNYINSRPINISGNFQKRIPRVVTASDRLKVIRAKLEKQNELLIKKKIESMRLRQEVMMMKRLQKMFDNNLKKMDAI